MKTAEELLGISRDDLAEILRAGYRSIIIEADEWRPLADHVLELVALAMKNSQRQPGDEHS